MTCRLVSLLVVSILSLAASCADAAGKAAPCKKLRGISCRKFRPRFARL